MKEKSLVGTRQGVVVQPCFNAGHAMQFTSELRRLAESKVPGKVTLLYYDSCAGARLQPCPVT